MAHGLLANDTMFSVRQVPWHGLGTVIENAPTIAEGIQLAGLDWGVEMSDLTIKSTGELSEYRSIIRQDINAELGIVGQRFHPLQNIDAFNFFDPFLENGLATLETAGSLFDGKKVWILAKIAGTPVQIKGHDEIIRYVLLSNGHDGNTSVNVGFVPVRCVCNNTLSMALNSKASKLIKVKHTQNVKVNVQSVFDIMNLVNQEFEATEQQYRYLASQDINQSDLEKYVKLIFGKEDKKLKLKEDDEMVIESNRVVSKVLAMWDQNKDVTPNNFWGAYNLVNTYLCHEDGRSQEGRLNKMWFGESARKDKQALELALKMADKRVNHKLVTV
jgi:phage/plasmid-like protein (TIGR03299 family)